MKTNNPFSGLMINRATIEAIISANGYSDFQYKPAGKLFHLSCAKDSKSIRLAVYENKNGSTTLSCLNGEDKSLFEALASLIAQECAIAAPGRVEFSFPKFDLKAAADFLDFLRIESVDVKQHCPSASCTQYRLQGKQGDILTVNLYTNGTLQCQGHGGMLAAHAIDYLSNVMSYRESITLQLKTFKVEMTVEAALDGLAGALRQSYPKLGDTVRAQFASSLALTKMELALADFGAIAFPALRGMEGMLKNELTNAGFDLTRFKDFGEYFEPSTVGRYVMKPLHTTVAKEPRATALAETYTLFYSQRHGIAHMGHDPETSRVLATMNEAKSIVNAVFGSIERFYTTVYP